MYKMAIRWASDRIKEQGVIAFVTNGSWIDANVDAGNSGMFGGGVQFNLRSDTCGGMQGPLVNGSRSEGGQRLRLGGSRAPVAITILVKNPDAAHDGCRIYYPRYW